MARIDADVAKHLQEIAFDKGRAHERARWMRMIGLHCAKWRSLGRVGIESYALLNVMLSMSGGRRSGFPT